MHEFHSIEEVRTYVRALRAGGESIGFVPTMGCLHEGHLSLVKKAVEDCGTVIVSIYVNPTQFGPDMDFDRYPRDVARDRELLESAGATAIFLPTTEIIYPEGACSWVEVEGMTELLDGASRPGYFRGIATVVMKLFAIVACDRAYFGQKDIQQAMMIRRMAHDFHLDLVVEIMPTIREDDGLAMSSRNTYLGKEQRACAPTLYRGLQRAMELFTQGERNAKTLIEACREIVASESQFEVDYIDLVSLDTFHRVDIIEAPVALALAVDLNGTRLIDNVILRP